MSLVERITGRQRRTVVVAVLVVSLVLGAGASAVEISTSLEEFRGGTEAAAADDYIEGRMSGGAANTTQAFVVIRPENGTSRGTNVLTRGQYVQTLRAQQALLNDSTVNRTLHPEQPPLSIANVVAMVAIQEQRGVDVDNMTVMEPRPPLDRQIEAVRGLNSFERELYTSYAVGEVLDDASHTWPAGGAFAFVPTTYEANQKTAPTTAIVVSHRESTDPRDLTRAQLATERVVDRHLTWTEAVVVGDGTVNAELRQSSIDSLLIVGPVAFLLVVVVLYVFYRDWIDVALGLLGVGLVLLWTFGYMGWAGVTFNQVFVAVPVLLMGLSIDYALHVFMRYREEREAHGEGESRATGAAETGPGGFRFGARPVPAAMGVALAGVGSALVLVTFTTATGFLSNLTSGVAPIREFGVVSAVGIVAALVVFGAFVPALKVEVDEYLEARGRARDQRAVGTGGGTLSTLLALSIAVCRNSPWGVVALALLVTAGGVAGATTLGTDFQREDLLVEEGSVPDWTRDLPEPFRPGNYTAQADLDYVERQNFVYRGTSTQVLIRGDVTRPDALERVQRTTDRLNDSEVTMVFPNRLPGTRSTVTMMEQVADRNESFNRTFRAADTNGNGVPDRNLTRVYGAFLDAAPEGAPTMVHRADGEYRALRVKFPVNGTYSNGHITAEVRNATAPVQGEGLRATATGQPVKNQAVAAQLLDTVSRALALTLLVVLVGLVLAYHRTEGEWTLGVVTLVPVAMAVSWILGTMAVLDIPFNVMTALITSFTIGIGIDYSIHVSERYVQELAARADPDEALERSVLGTGGALLSSAVTDISGVGVLAFAILVPLQQFGIITAVTIAYSFLASVMVLPALLVLWTRRYGSHYVRAERAAPAD